MLGVLVPYKCGRNRVLARLFVVGVAWLTALVVFAALLQWPGSPPSGVGPSRDGVTALARSLNQLRPTFTRGEYAWTVTKATSALGALVVEVDAIDPNDARQIAELLVNGVRNEYDQILVYVQSASRGRDSLIRRIEWTPSRGYLASAF